MQTNTQPRVDSNSVNLERLAALPPNTFGHQYAVFMRSQGFVPEDRAPVRFVADPQLAYVLQRYREAHDFWHVLCAVPTSVQGELALKVRYSRLNTFTDSCAPAHSL
jgi:ubiquinone biosynthesis protein COQ4